MSSIVVVLTSFCFKSPLILTTSKQQAYKKMAGNPRKFSEKIALMNQKEAEHTTAFNSIMGEVRNINQTLRATMSGSNTNLSELVDHSSGASSGASFSANNVVTGIVGVVVVVVARHQPPSHQHRGDDEQLLRREPQGDVRASAAPAKRHAATGSSRRSLSSITINSNSSNCSNHSPTCSCLIKNFDELAQTRAYRRV